MDYETFGSKPNRATRMDSETSNTSSASSASREIDVLPSAVRIKDTPFGMIRVPSDLEEIEIAFLVLASASILGVIAMAIYRLAEPIDDSDSTFALVLLINSVFCLVYIFHGVFGERPYELWVFMIATVAVVLYCVIEYAVTSHRVTLKLVRLIVVSVFAPVDLFLSFKISMQHYTSKNLIIRTLRSAKITFQNMCMNMFIFQALLKFDTQTGSSLVILVLTSGVEDADSREIAIVVVGLSLEIVWLIVGTLLPKYEDVRLLYAFIVLSLPQPAYVLFKIIRTGQNWNEQSKIINASIIACACLFLVTRCLVSYYLWIVVKNFNKGLREAVYFPAKQRNTEQEQGTSSLPSPKHNGPDDDYLGENVHYDVHN